MDKEQLITEFETFNSIGRRLILMELLERGSIDFPELSTMYVQSLKKEQEKNAAHRAKLTLHLGVYCMNDQSDNGKFIRRFLYDTRYFTSSPFGDRLEAEFGKPEEKEDNPCSPS